MGLFYLLCLLCIMSSLSATASSLTKSKVVILGGGIHGASIAYHLSQLADPPHITVLERSRVAAAASGKAGGFLAREWGSGSTVQLHQHSFDLHKELAEKFQLSSFRLLDVLSLDGTARAKRPAGGNAASWLDRQVKSSSLSGAAAQVTPLELTERLMLESRAEVVIEIAQGLERNAAGELVGVKTASGRVLEADKVCVSMGPWSGVWVEDYLDVRFPMEGVKSTSMVFEGVDAIKKEPFACFSDEDSRYNTHLELYPRPNGDLYVCGCGGSDYVSGDRLREGGDCYDPENVVEDVARVEAATASLKSMSSVGDVGPTVVQACMRPCPPDGLPVMDSIPCETAGGVRDGEVFVSAGMNCWGILWAPICGKTMAELIHTGSQDLLDLRSFSIDRFNPLLRGLRADGDGDKKGGRGRKMGEKSVGEQW